MLRLARFWVMLCCLSCAALGASPENYEQSPLQPLDSSSPRATIQSFLNHVETGHAANKLGDAQAMLIATYLSREALDFSDTARGWLFEEQINRVALLKEVLDRLPPEVLEQAPDTEAISLTGSNRWTIPDTRINLYRVDGGSRDGEWLFAPESVANLHHYFRRVKHLPYLSGNTQGFYDSRLQQASRVASRIRDKLRPVEAMSPREVVNQFLYHVNNAYELRESIEDGATRAKLLEVARRAELHLDRAMELMDLSEIPASIRRDIGVEVTLMLKEVIDRAPLPPIASIPGERVIARSGQSEGIRWLLPHTGIEIVRLNKGREPEQYRFSAHTVQMAEAFYDTVAHLPYRGETNTFAGEENQAEAEYLNAAVSPGFFESYRTTPGSLIPEVSWLAPLIAVLPAGSSAVILGQTLWQWFMIVLSIPLIITVWLLPGRLVSRLEQKHSQQLVNWLRILPPVFAALVTISVAKFLDDQVNLTGYVNVVVLLCAIAITYLFAALATFRFVVAATETLFASAAADDRFQNLVGVGARILGFLIAVIVFVYGIGGLGIDVLPVLAGLGVGGLAVALAIRPTLENIIGGVILYSDRPVHVGDYCTFGDKGGVVESIGIRSTRIRGRNRTLMTVPNSLFVDMEITNWGLCDKMQITEIVGVRYETRPDQLRRLLAAMRQVCFAHPMIETETLRVRFAGFGASSLNIAVRVYALTRDWNEFHAVREDLFVRFMEVIEECGTSVAFPSTTVYLGEDSGLDAEAVAQAEAEVVRWREAGELPFPLTPEPLAKRITDTLDYPPKGSPGNNYPKPKDND